MRLSLAGFVVVVGRVSATPWEPEIWQNVSMCNWAEARANIIRDTVYVDGGNLWWEPGLTDGQLGTPKKDNNANGATYALALGQPFNQSSNLTALFQQMPSPGGQASNLAPNYVDGAMFATEDEFILYGGLLSNTVSSSPPGDDVALSYEAYPTGSDSQPKFVDTNLPDGITRYVTNGAAISSLSEKLGFYFSGMRATNWSSIASDDPGSANTLADTLITVNMSTVGHETWSNRSLGDIPARANAEIQWLPVADQGVLVAVGGVINPVALTTEQALNKSQIAASEATSPTFMKTASVYDVATETWYQQNTTGNVPPQLTLFCSALAIAEDRSSFNIYIYGGYDGLQSNNTPSDDVYILSVPQFVWTHAYTGGIYQGDPYTCLDRIVEVFNLNTLSFQNSYDPRVWDEYRVPDAVTANIGGNENGSATMLSPESWGDEQLSSIFSTQYTKAIPTYYPYPLQSPNSTSTSSPTVAPTVSVGNGGGGLPTWVAPVLGVVLGLIVVAAATIIFLLWWRKKGSKNWGASDTQGSTSGLKGFVLRWLHGTAGQEGRSSKGPTELQVDDDATTVVSSARNDRHISEVDSYDVHEMADRHMPRFEMPTDYNHSRDWSRSSWSQPEISPPLVSPNIGELMERDPLDSNSTLPTPASAVGPPTMRPTQSRTRRISDRSDGTSISELDASDSGRPPHSRQLSDNSISDVGASDGNSVQTSSGMERRPQSPGAGHIQTVHEVEEPNGVNTVRGQGPSELG
ncbi:Cytochrome c oxidase subunit 1 [Talaromyces islandicus]|uniref:Cytochrome c oxidase subunit 1 n=1 Tax=Talaromyces islandicus TaxID=28573 RepID=A0A0U1LWR3_TALIS|nr:Cytochrome c oxidase subunit 1 [Talaromyces islandicus]